MSPHNIIRQHTIVLLAIAFVFGCGRDIAKDLQPEITVVNIIPGSRTDRRDCVDCPGAPAILEMYAMEIDPDTWGLGVQSSTGCETFDNAFTKAYLRVPVDGGYYERLPDVEIIIERPASYCFNEIAVWILPQFCDGLRWCGYSESEVWVEFYALMSGFYFVQGFTQLGGELPIQ